MRSSEEIINQEYNEVRVTGTLLNAGRLSQKDAQGILPRGSERNIRAGALRPGSGMAKVREFILEKGRPGQVTELLEALGRPATREARASLSGSLAAYVRKGEISRDQARTPSD